VLNITSPIQCAGGTGNGANLFLQIIHNQSATEGQTHCPPCRKKRDKSGTTGDTGKDEPTKLCVLDGVAGGAYSTRIEEART
jgi:hypothetical protein